MTDSKFTPQELLAAFQDFERLSGDLSAAYTQLQQRVTALTEELAQSREQQERELQEKERLSQRMHSLLDVLPAGILVLNGSGVVVQTNPVAHRLLGEPLLQQAWRDVVQRVVAPRWDDGHDVTLKSGACVNIATQALPEQPGQIVMLTDVTETRRLQDQLSHHKRLSARGEIAAKLAHQIRTPLASALLYANNLGHTGLDAGRRERFIDKLTGRLKHLEQLVEDMLLFARGGGKLDAVSLSLPELMDDLMSAIEPRLNESGYQVALHRPVPALSIRGNPDALQSVMVNLVNNAIESSQGQGSMTISVAMDGQGMACLEFADDGPGIDPAVQQKIFEPFVTTRAEGTGLGLAVVQAVVSAHQGRLTLHSTPGEGATFRIHLPVIPVADMPAGED